MSIIVNTNQKGNPLLEHIKNIRYEFKEIKPDYQVGTSTGILFLSLKYHKLHPEYIYTRFRTVKPQISHLILLVLIDTQNVQQTIRELTNSCIRNKITLFLCWNQEDAARYIETFKRFENKPPDLLKDKIDDDPFSKLTAMLTGIRSVNKTDVVTLSSHFDSFYDIIHATDAQLKVLPGFGDSKVENLKQAFETNWSLDD
ncbi:restriction endonuclease type II-like protein [Globomyces pollinis-pini]|nr:restriction endonuclease type II-like protein [Globomyces pollinis-pini]